MSDPTICPRCGKRKRTEFALCFDCGTDDCPRCGGPKLRDYEVCLRCSLELEEREEAIADVVRSAEEEERQRTGCWTTAGLVFVAVLVLFVIWCAPDLVAGSGNPIKEPATGILT